MDALKAEIALKRKTLEIPVADGRPTKYMRKGDIERLKEEQERKAKEEKEAKEREAARRAGERKKAEEEKARKEREQKGAVSNIAISREMCVLRR